MNNCHINVSLALPGAMVQFSNRFGGAIKPETDDRGNGALDGGYGGCPSSTYIEISWGKATLKVIAPSSSPTEIAAIPRWMSACAVASWRRRSPTSIRKTMSRGFLKTWRGGCATSWSHSLTRDTEMTRGLVMYGGTVTPGLRFCVSVCWKVFRRTRTPWRQLHCSMQGSWTTSAKM